MTRPGPFILPLLFAGVAGCSMAPPYRTPTIALPTTWKNVDGWAPAAPADAFPRGKWWAAYLDPDLDRLMVEADLHNQTVAEAVATYARARAETRELRASLFPTVSADGSTTRSRVNSSNGFTDGSPNSPGAPTDLSSRGQHVSNYNVGIGVSWEPDFFGRIHNAVSDARLTAQARAADIGSARLAIHGELAASYLALRATDEQMRLLTAAIEAYERSLQIAVNRYNAGVVASADIFQAQSQLALVKSELEGLKRLRARFENAIATLVGRPAPSFTIASRDNWVAVVPLVPTVLPSILLERRPDIASAEREVAAANARIGVARAAYSPQVGLSGQYGFNNDSLSGLFSATASVWSLGAQIVGSIFDFGARKARVAGTRAAYDAVVASYRNTVLNAFQDVQDTLVAESIIAHQTAYLRDASVAADRAEESIRSRYEAGIVTYTDVVSAQVIALAARRAVVQSQLDQQTTAVALIQALGGEWTREEIGRQ